MEGKSDYMPVCEVEGRRTAVCLALLLHVYVIQLKW